MKEQYDTTRLVRGGCIIFFNGGQFQNNTEREKKNPLFLYIVSKITSEVTKLYIFCNLITYNRMLLNKYYFHKYGVQLKI
jgi:hypothetical protein